MKLSDAEKEYMEYLCGDWAPYWVRRLSLPERLQAAKDAAELHVMLLSRFGLKRARRLCWLADRILGRMEQEEEERRWRQEREQAKAREREHEKDPR